MLGTVSRQALRTRRPFNAVVLDLEGKPILWVRLSPVPPALAREAAEPETPRVATAARGGLRRVGSASADHARLARVADPETPACAPSQIRRPFQWINSRIFVHSSEGPEPPLVGEAQQSVPPPPLPHADDRPTD